MANYIDETGNKYGRLTVLSKASKDKWSSILWLCSCTCGNAKVILGKYLRNGEVKSCGCAKADLIKAARTKHGQAGTHKGKERTIEYSTWASMIRRCYNKKEDNYKYYGGRGIKVCKSWRESFEAFFNHVGIKPSSKHSIDRINNDGNYEPGNVRWATPKEQRTNKRAYGTAK